MDRERFCEAIRASWTRSTSADPDEWTEANPGRGQCDVTSLVILEYLGGDLQHARVFLDGEQIEHHYWNQFTATDALDLTQDQFTGDQTISEPDLVTQEFIRSKYPTARSELRERHQLLRRAVTDHLGVGAPEPLE